MAIAPSGWDTSLSIRSLIAIAPTIVFKSFSGAPACSELDCATSMFHGQAPPSSSSYLSKVDKPRKKQSFMRQMPSPGRYFTGHELYPDDRQAEGHWLSIRFVPGN